jgi:putative acyl-CoA dehydrogenase
MKNVLADLTLESQAATLLAFRLARAFDATAKDEREHDLARMLTPVAKYWLCKRLPMIAAEAMECLGGNGYVEEAPLARFYREAPLNGIWEGSGNVICLDVLRSLDRQPAAGEALIAEVRAAGGALDSAASAVEKLVAATRADQGAARGVVECAALSLQASLMERFAPRAAADAFVATRINGQGGRQLGTLPAGVDFDAILSTAWAD